MSRKQVILLLILSVNVFGVFSFSQCNRRLNDSYFERIDFVFSYSIRELDDPSGWILFIKMKCDMLECCPRYEGNFVNLIVDNEPIPESNYNQHEIVPGEITTSIPDTKEGLIIKSGETGLITVYVSDENIEDGSTISMNIKLHTKNGNDHIKIFSLYKSQIYQ